MSDTLPEASATERALIGAVLVFPHTLDAPGVGDLEPEHFYVPAMADVWRAIRSLVAEGKPVDVHTVPAALDGARRQELAHAIADAATVNPANVGAWVEVIRTHARARAMLLPLQAAVVACRDGHVEDVFDLLNVVLDAGEVPPHVCR